ncbi:MAG TPA: STAS domain-containing protein [Jatrophihabitans sp.]|jgi:anti-anti-sigma factor
MQLQRRVEGDVTTLAVAGDVDIRSAAELRDAGTRELEEVGCAKLVLDLSGIEFIDSTGLGALLGIRLVAEKQDKPVVLHAPSEHVFYVIDLAGLSEDFIVDGI